MLADARAIEEIRVRTWRVAYRHALPPAELDAMPIDETRWAHRLNDMPKGWRIHVAEADGRVQGFAGTGPSRDERQVGELYALYVMPDCWSTGMGRALIQEAEAGLAEDYEVATLWVLEANARARRFYEQAGWQPDDARKEEEFLGTRVAEVRYRKRFSTSRSPS